METIATQIHTVNVNDTNQHGTIFGGKVMELADQVAAMCARRYALQPVITASLDRIDFLSPIVTGEEVHLTPRIVCVHKHSMQVAVEVKAVNVLKKKERHTSKILFTFVAIDEKKHHLVPVPRWEGPETSEFQACRLRYQQRKNPKTTKPHDFPKEPKCVGKKPSKKMSDSLVENHHLVMPTDHNNLGLLFAGRYLSWVDIAGSLAARRHCGGPVVTASIEEVNFRQRVPKGSTVHLIAKPVFNARKSVQIQVGGWLWADPGEEDLFVADAFLTFVPLHPKTGKPIAVPQLEFSSQEEQEAYLFGQWRYSRRKQEMKRLQ